MLTSCSKDDNNSTPSPTLFVKKTISYEGDAAPYLEYAEYSGNKILNMTDKYRSVKTFTYDGDLITKTVTTNRFGIIIYSTDYVYRDKKLVTSISKEDGTSYFYKVEYTHNSDATVTYKESKIDTLTGAIENVNSSGKYFFKNGNLVKKEYTYMDNEKESTTYEYDTKSAPFKNILGLNLLLNSEEDLSVNNIIKETDVIGLNNNVNIKTYSYKYNANNYPTEKVKIYHDGSSPIGIIEYVY